MSIRFPNINLEFMNVPRAFRILDREFTVFGALVAAGMLLGMLLIILHAKRKGKNPNNYLGASLFAVFGGIIGARLLYAVCNWEMFSANPMELLLIRDGGLSLYGALIGGSLFVCLYCKMARLSFLEVADTLTLGVLLCQAIGRWGDFFNRCSFGEYTDRFYAMQLPLSGVRSGEVTEMMRENAVTYGKASYIQVTPLFLAESIFCIVLLIILDALSRKKKFNGAIFYQYLAWYGLVRFGLEWFRTDKLMIPGTQTSLSLVLAGGSFILFGLSVLIRSSLANKRSAIRKKWEDKDYHGIDTERTEAAARLEENRSADSKEEIRERISQERLAAAEEEKRKREEEENKEAGEKQEEAPEEPAKEEPSSAGSTPEDEPAKDEAPAPEEPSPAGSTPEDAPAQDETPGQNEESAENAETSGDGTGTAESGLEETEQACRETIEDLIPPLDGSGTTEAPATE